MHLLLKLKHIVLCSSFLLLLHKGNAQTGSKQEEAMACLQKARSLYTDSGGLRMNIVYYYAGESAPSRYLDSVKGSLVLKGADCRMKMDGVETIANERFSITLFEEDKLMYLSRPVTGASYNPLASLDTLLAHLKGGECKVLHEKGYTIVQITFTPGQAYKKMLFRIDDTSGFLAGTSMTLQTRFLAPDAGQDTLKKMGYDEYAIIETRLSGYRRESVASAYFSEEQFFYRQDKAFLVTDRYRDYKIFVATPNL